MTGDLLSVGEAAALLGVSRRRAEALIQSGALPAQRVGARWILSAGALRQTEHNMWREAGRPMSQRSAWMLIKQRLEGHSFARPALDQIRRRLRARATHCHLFVHPSRLQLVTDSPTVILGGRTAAQVAGVPIDDSVAFDVYVRASAFEELIRESGAQRVNEGANLNVHVIEDEQWPFEPDQRVVSPWVAWLDLADSQDRAADTLLDRIAGGRVRD